MKIPETVPWRSTGVTLGSGGQGQVHLVTRKGDPSGDKFALKASAMLIQNKRGSALNAKSKL